MRHVFRIDNILKVEFVKQEQLRLADFAHWPILSVVDIGKCEVKAARL